MKTVHVDLQDRSYDILIGQGLISNAAAHLAPHLHRAKVAIVTDENVARLHAPQLQSALTQAGISHDTLVLPAGETTKSWGPLTQTVEWL